MSPSPLFRWPAAGSATPPYVVGALAVLVALGTALLAGCASSLGGPAAQDPSDAEPVREIPDFASELRCMDGLLLDFGVHDVPLSIEAVADPAHRLGTGSGAANLLTIAVSDMTRSSRAIRIVAPDQPDASRPVNSLRGALSLADDGSSGATLSFDASLLGPGATLIPGSAARHDATLARSGGNYTGKAMIRQFGIAFALTSAPAESLQQASRALAELSAIEQIGRMARVPYWSCLGAPPARQAIAAEIRDWYDALASHPAEMIRYVQEQLRTRGVYAGPVDGTVNPELKEALARYRETLGLSREPKVSLDFFGAYLGADHRRLASQLAAAAPLPVDPAPGAAPAPPSPPARPLALRLTAEDDSRHRRRADTVQLVVRPSRDAYVYCFLRDEDRHVVRFFPNHFQREALVQTAGGLELPGSLPFEIALDSRGIAQTVACFASERDVLARLPAAPGADRFAPQPFAALSDVASAMQDATAGAFAQASLELAPGN